jgi:polyhydroxybutyrate depolymerase
MIRFVAILTMALFAMQAAAQDCGDADTPCQTQSGSYYLTMPEGSGPHPVMVFLHGFGGTGEGVIRNRGLLKPMLERGYAVLAPQGLPFSEGMKGGSWNSMKRAGRRDDVAFLSEVADEAASRFDLDRDTVLLAGFSGGGMMTWRVACDAPGSFAAYAPVAGLLWLPLPEKCEGPFRMQHTHGWSDPVVPIEGRSVANGQFTQGDLFVGLTLLRRANGCLRDDPDEYAENAGYLIRRWFECAEGAALEFALHPGGHRIPAGWSALAMDWFEALQTGNGGQK